MKLHELLYRGSLGGTYFKKVIVREGGGFLAKFDHSEYCSTIGLEESVPTGSLWKYLDDNDMVDMDEEEVAEYKEELGAMLRFANKEVGTFTILKDGEIEIDIE